MKTTNYAGIFLPGLALVFITLKLTHYISWSWWWVLSPLWVLPVVCLVIILVAVFVEAWKEDAKKHYDKDAQF